MSIREWVKKYNMTQEFEIEFLYRVIETLADEETINKFLQDVENALKNNEEAENNVCLNVDNEPLKETQEDKYPKGEYEILEDSVFFDFSLASDIISSCTEANISDIQQHENNIEITAIIPDKVKQLWKFDAENEALDVENNFIAGFYIKLKDDLYFVVTQRCSENPYFNVFLATPNVKLWPLPQILDSKILLKQYRFKIKETFFIINLQEETIEETDVLYSPSETEQPISKEMKIIKTTDAEQSVPIKKKRGRPPKTVKTEPIVKKRGRPKKVKE